MMMKIVRRKKERGRRKYLWMLLFMLCFCLMITICPFMPGATVVYAEGDGTSENPWLCGANGNEAGVTATLSADGTLTISGSGNMQNYNNYSKTPPWYQLRDSITCVKIESGVTSIGEFAFWGCSSLTSVTIPEGVTRIGNSAFYGCSSLTSIEIPASVTSIENNPFAGCSSLTNITVKDGNTNYRSDANAIIEIIHNKLIVGCMSTTIPEGVKSIGYEAFCGCSGLTSVTIPNGVTSIERSAFYGCSGLTSVTIPNSVTKIEDSAFSGCSSLTSVTIPNSVTSIESATFYGCSGLTSVTIPESVTSIANYAFYGCSGLTSVTIPNSVTRIGSAFSGCSSLTSVTIPDSETSIERSAFYGCSSLTSVIIPGSVTSIGDNAFSGCSRLESVTIPDKVTSIGSYAFSNCRGLTSVTIPDSVTSIGGNAFNGCSGLTSVTIPDSVTSIGGYAFWGCESLNKVTMDRVTPPELGSMAFYACPCVRYTKGIYVPVGTVDDYKKATGWTSYRSSITDGTPEITTQPRGMEVQNGKQVKFSVKANGVAPLRYQWQVKKTNEDNFTNIEGATSSDYIISAVSNECDGNQYRCVVTNDRGEATSKSATLTVTYRVTYDYETNGGNYSSGTYFNPIAKGETIDLKYPTATKYGWDFVGWNTDKDAKTGLDSLTMGDSDVTLYAIYSKTLNARFYSGNIRQEPEFVSVTIYNKAENGDITLPDLKNWAGDSHTYTVEGWKRESSDSLLTAGENFTLTQDDESFYGRYKRIVTLSFDANHGRWSESEETEETEITGYRYATVKEYKIDYVVDEITLPDKNKLSRVGYTFSGWAQGSLDGEVVEGGESVSIPEENTTYYAQWTANQYSITYIGLDGASLSQRPEKHTYGVETPIGNPTKPGYTFAGWRVNEGSATKDLTLGKTDYTADITLTATWKINTYAVTLVSGEGYKVEAVNSESPVNYGDSYSFRVIVEPGYDASSMKVMVNGSKVLLNEANEYTMTNISEKKEVTVTGVTKDTQAPGITIAMAGETWTSLRGSTSFDLFYKENQTATVAISDRGSGVKEVWYYLAEEEMTADKVKQITAWQEYNGDAPLSISEEGNYVICVKAEDEAGNISYANSEGLVLDKMAPKIEIAGIINEGVCCEVANVTVTEKNLKVDGVTVNGSPVTLDSGNSFTLTKAEGEQTITVTDKAGNVSSKAVTVSAHDFGDWSITKEPTATEDGTQTRTCSNCGKTEEKTIPATVDPNAGKLEKGADVEKGAPVLGASFNNKEEELLKADGILTTEEKAEVTGGKDVKVWLEISNTVEDEVSETDKMSTLQAAEQVLGNDAKLVYFDVDLFKQIEGGTKTQITEPGINIEVTIKIPDTLLNHDKTILREYKIIRLHNGEVTVISGDFDAETGAFSFETDKFSTYAIAYSDKQLVTGDNTGDSQTTEQPDTKTEAPNTGDDSNPAFWTFLMLMSMTALVGLFVRKRKTERHGER